VKNGAFVGLKFPKNNYYLDSILPKLAGSYESEIQSILELFCQRKYETVINIGAADGYYLNGLALRLHNARFIGFEASDQMRGLSLLMSELNGILNRIEILGIADSSSLLSLGDFPNVLIISDCEGAELEIFNQEVIRFFDSADFLIETHDCFRQGLTDELKNRFEISHEVVEIHSISDKDRRLESVLSCTLSPIEKFYLTQEGREEDNGWIYCKSRKN
jgi:hypothetical protein